MNKPSVAVVGCGYWGRNLIRNFFELGRLAAVCETAPEGQRRARQIAPGVPVLADFQEVLDSAVAGVVIATPAETHHALAARALAAGKDTFVEKPLALTLEDGRDLVHRAQGGPILMVGHILEYHPACEELCDMVERGDLGQLYYLYSNRLSLGKVRREENILWSFAPHDVALMLRLAQGVPRQVAAFGGAYLQPQVADVTTTHLLFDEQVRAHIHVSWLHPFKEQRLVVVGSRRMAVFDGVEGSLTCYDQRVDFDHGEPVPIKKPGVAIEVSGEEPLRRECLAFLTAIETRTPPRTDGMNGVRVLAVLEAAQTSLSSDGAAIPVEMPI